MDNLNIPNLESEVREVMEFFTKQEAQFKIIRSFGNDYKMPNYINHFENLYNKFNKNKFKKLIFLINKYCIFNNIDLELFYRDTINFYTFSSKIMMPLSSAAGTQSWKDMSLDRCAWYINQIIGNFDKLGKYYYFLSWLKLNMELLVIES